MSMPGVFMVAKWPQHLQPLTIRHLAMSFHSGLLS